MKWKELSGGKKPRRQTVRAKRRPRRPPQRGRMRGIALGLALLLLIGGGWFSYPYVWNWLCQNPYFKITRITFTGLQNVTEKELRSLLPPLGGTNLLALDTSTLRARLTTHPWVAEAHLHRQLPDKLQIEISEREPVALAYRGGLWALDVRGVVLPLEARSGEMDLPLIQLGVGPRPSAGLALVEPRLVALLPQLQGLHHRLPELWSAISEINWDEAGQLELIALARPAKILVGQHPSWSQMLNLYSFLLYQGQRADLADIAFVDLRFSGQVVIRRATETADSTSPGKET